MTSPHPETKPAVDQALHTPADIDKEIRVFGPPGTGKTTWISHQVRRSAEVRGSENIVVASFTRAAAEELGGRGLPIPASQLGTLHALCFRALDRPRIASGEIDSWNAYAPHLRLSGGTKGDVDEAAYDANFDTPADAVLSQVEILRAQQTPLDRWPLTCRSFLTKWNAWKEGEQVLDFTDLIEQAIADVPLAPGAPQIGFFDEVQDFTPLELALVRKWGRGMERYLLAGDDDQCLYRFKGSRPEAFLTPELPEGNKRVLAQSYRVPAAVHHMAQEWVMQLSRREPKDYRPRTLDDGSEAIGAAHLLPAASWRAPEAALDHAQTQIDDGRTVMFLASCSFMLDPVKHLLRDRGIPFHNPYRKKRGDWNPLAVRGETTAIDRLLAFLRDDETVFGDGARPWNYAELHRWADVLKAEGVLNRGAKAQMARAAVERANDNPLTDGDALIYGWFTEEALERALEMDLDWWEKHMLAARRNPILFPIQVHRRLGAQALMEVPKVCIGTMHSVKGGQADVVYLFPDVSNAGMREWMSPGEQRDSVIRQMYVGMTRAKEEIVLCGPSSANFVDMRRFATAAQQLVAT